MSNRRDRARATWDIIHAERSALVSQLAGVDPERWEIPSICGAWTVHDVVAHQVATAKTTRISFVLGMVRARGDFDRDNAAGVARERGSTPAETLAALRTVVRRTSTPPAPLDIRLVEAIVHGEDIRRPLGLVGSYPVDAVVRALRLQARTSVSFGGARQHLAGVRLVATDTDVTIGEGAPVRGSALSLLLAVSGREVRADELAGEGVSLLLSRV